MVAVTGAGGLSLTPDPAYAHNVDAGTATASYTFTGDANHNGSNGSKDFTIEKAETTTTVSCRARSEENASELQPRAHAVCGAGRVNMTPDPAYAHNVD